MLSPTSTLRRPAMPGWLMLIEGPLRIADTDFPDRQWMLDLAELNIAKALAAI